MTEEELAKEYATEYGGVAGSSIDTYVASRHIFILFRNSSCEIENDNGIIEYSIDYADPKFSFEKINKVASQINERISEKMKDWGY